jgi:ankyrin repeat protein
MTLLGMAAQTGNLSTVKMLIDYSNCSSIDFNIKGDISTKPALLHLDLNNPERKYKNIGYFVVRKDIEETDFGEGPTPEGMEGLEWDMEINEDATVEPEKEPSDMNIYQWYANILNRSSLVLKSPDNDIARLDSHGKNVLHYAVRSGNMELVRYLVETFNEISVNQSDAASLSPLHIAASKCHLPLVRYLVDKGANVNCTCRERRTPLHVAAQHGYIEIMQVLIENEADINVFDMKERSPLSLAVLGSRESAVLLLIKNGARLNQEDAAGFTPLRRAVWNDCTPIAMMLLNAGARVVQSHYLLHAAARSNNAEIIAVFVNRRYLRLQATVAKSYRVSNNNCSGIHFIFKRLGFCNLLLIKCFFRWNMTQKLPKITRIYCQLNQYLLLTRYFNDL